LSLRGRHLYPWSPSELLSINIPSSLPAAPSSRRSLQRPQTYPYGLRFSPALCCDFFVIVGSVILSLPRSFRAFSSPEDGLDRFLFCHCRRVKRRADQVFFIATLFFSEVWCALRTFYRNSLDLDNSWSVAPLSFFWRSLKPSTEFYGFSPNSATGSRFVILNPSVDDSYLAAGSTNDFFCPSPSCIVLKKLFSLPSFFSETFHLDLSCLFLV